MGRRSRSRSRSTSNSDSDPPSKPKKIEPSFEPSGFLAASTNERNGIIVKYTIPQESRPPDKKWRLYVFKPSDKDAGPSPDKIIHISSKEYYLFGKEPRVCDIPIYHPSISKQHAVIQYRLNRGEISPYLIDLESTNGTFLNGERIESSRYYELFEKDCIKFANSSREYVLLHLDSN